MLACAAPRVGLTNKTTTRQRAEFLSKNASIIREGLVEEQDVKQGTIGPPKDALLMTGAGYHRVVTIHVLRAYRGLSEKTVSILTGMGTGDCGFDFETGQEYLVYADRLNDGELFTSICAGTSPVEEADPALRYLRGQPPLPEDLLSTQEHAARYGSEWIGSLCGRVAKPNGSPLAGANVQATQLRDEPLLPPYVAEDEKLVEGGRQFLHF